METRYTGLRCKHCGSTELESRKLTNGAYYPEIVHKPTCILLNTKSGVAYADAPKKKLKRD